MPGFDVSVVIPAFNMERFIGRALASVQRQSLAPAEIIVVDDGSTDNTAEVVERFSGVRLIRQPNRERGAARNIGAAAARSEWVAFLDGDDEWFQDHLERAWEKIRAGHADLTFGAYEIVSGDARRVRIRVPWPDADFTDKLRIFERVDSGGLCASNVVTRREVLKRFPFSEAREMSGSEDWHCWARLCGAVIIKPHQYCTARYHLHGQNSVFQVERMTRAMRFALADLVVDSRFRPRVRVARRRTEVLVSGELRAAGQHRRALSTLVALARVDPGVLTSTQWWITAVRSTAGLVTSRSATQGT